MAHYGGSRNKIKLMSKKDVSYEKPMKKGKKDMMYEKYEGGMEYEKGMKMKKKKKMKGMRGKYSNPGKKMGYS